MRAGEQFHGRMLCIGKNRNGIVSAGLGTLTAMGKVISCSDTGCGLAVPQIVMRFRSFYGAAQSEIDMKNHDEIHANQWLVRVIQKLHELDAALFLQVS